MPPSGANTNSVCAIGRHLVLVKPEFGARQWKNLAGRNCLQTAVGEAKQQTPAVIEVLAAADKLAIRQPHPHRLADASRAREPIVAYSRKTGPAPPLPKPLQHGA